MNRFPIAFACLLSASLAYSAGKYTFYKPLPKADLTFCANLAGGNADALLRCHITRDFIREATDFEAGKIRKLRPMPVEVDTDYANEDETTLIIRIAISQGLNETVLV